MPRQVRPIRIDGDVAYVPLTKGHEAIIDTADVSLIASRNWYVKASPRAHYAGGTEYISGLERSVLLHRVIMGEPVGVEVDHINGDGLDNRRCNLRLVTKAQNQHNSRIPANNTSGFKGVNWNKKAGKWHAQIMTDGKRTHLGLFRCAASAAIAYAKASRDLHGEFGRVA